MPQDDFRRIVEHCSTAIIVQRNERVVYANPAAIDVLGFRAASDLNGKQVSQFVEPESYATLASNFVKVVPDDDQLFMGELKMKRHDGSIIDTEAYHAGVLFEGAEATLLNFRDVTNTKRLELELRQGQKLESMGRLAAGIAHELNTPIQYIGDSAQYLSQSLLEILGLLFRSRDELRQAVESAGEDAGRLAEEEEAADVEYAKTQIPKSIERIIDGVTRVSRIVSAMKSFSHPGGESAVPMDVNKMLRDTLTIAAHELRVVTEVPTTLEPLPQVLGFPSELNQAFLNLVVNAAHAIADGPHKEHGVLNIRTRCDGDHVEISIGDNGCGMTPEVKNRLFEPFFTTKEVGRGTGQGLSIVRAAIVKHGGAINFDSTPGVGTVCALRIPLAPLSA